MRRDSGLPRGTWGESGKAPGRCGSQKRKKGPKALFSSTQAETWIMFGAGNETCTRALSRCFPNTFFAEVASEDLNCSLVFRPRQQVRPKKSIDVQRRPLRAPEPHIAHHRPLGLELATCSPLSASASPPRCSLSNRHRSRCGSDAAVNRHASHIAAPICASHIERTHAVAVVRLRSILCRYIRMLG